jgi:hypothetical protein
VRACVRVVCAQVHDVVFTQVRTTPPLTYGIEVKQDIYFATAVQEILTDLVEMNSCKLVALDNFFGENELRQYVIGGA